jgi:hypothetical protein
MTHQGREMFFSGLMHDVTFNPRAEVITDLPCSNGKSEADAMGRLKQIDKKVQNPADTVFWCVVDYDTERKVFHDKNDPSFTFDQADYLVLDLTGRAHACWRTVPQSLGK